MPPALSARGRISWDHPTLMPQLENPAPPWDRAQQPLLHQHIQGNKALSGQRGELHLPTSDFHLNILSNNHEVVFVSITSRCIASNNTLALYVFILFSMKFHSVSGFGSRMISLDVPHLTCSFCLFQNVTPRAGKPHKSTHCLGHDFGLLLNCLEKVCCCCCCHLGLGQH